MNWFIFSIIALLCWSGSDFFSKIGCRDAKDKYSHLKTGIMVGLVMGIHAIFTLLTSDIAYNPMNLIAYLPVSMCYIVSMACSYFGIRFIEESLADPIENTAGAMCSILCVVFLGETIAPSVWVAIAVIVVGIVGVSYGWESQITACYSQGLINNGVENSGIVGYYNGECSINNCYTLHDSSLSGDGNFSVYDLVNQFSSPINVAEIMKASYSKYSEYYEAKWIQRT